LLPPGGLRDLVIDREQIREAVASIILAIGEDPKREGLVDTPRRVADAYEEFFSGLDQDPSEVLATSYEEGHTELVVLKDIPFVSLCEHHLLPFYGNAAIGYVPSGRVVGVSKLARALDILARRPQLQERLTRQLADTIFKALKPDGVGVVLSAEHLCVSLRGVKKPGSKVVTSASRGSVRTQEAVRRDFYAALGQH
jgi:GTP cyclohydrolase I